MQKILFLTAATVLLSYALNGQAETKYDQLLRLHQNGPLAAPVFIPKEREYVCFARTAPDQPIHVVIEGHATSITKITATSAIVNRLLTGQVVPLSPAQLPMFNGSVLGGRSQAANLIESLRRQYLNPSYFALSVHTPSIKNLAAIIKIEESQDLENACRSSENIEYVCIEDTAEG